MPEMPGAPPRDLTQPEDCPHCGETCKNHMAMWRHKQRCDDNPDPPCRWCGLKFEPHKLKARDVLPAPAGRSHILRGPHAAPMKFTFNYTGLRVRDLDANVRFFTQGLGMKETSRDKIPETGGVVCYLESEGHAHRLELN